MDETEQSPRKPVRMLSLEKELAGEGGMTPQQALQKYDGVLLALAERLKTAMDQGLPQDDFERCRALDGAIVTARKLFRLSMPRN